MNILKTPDWIISGWAFFVYNNGMTINDEKTLTIYIDDSGQLHPDYPISDYFVYGGFWVLKTDIDQVKSKFKILLQQRYHGKAKFEIKASAMKPEDKAKFVRRIISSFKKSFAPVSIIEKLDLCDAVDFTNKKNVQLHKNYLLRRFVEDAINNAHSVTSIQFEKVEVFIDNQTATNVGDSIQKYLNKYFHGSYYSQNWTSSEAKFSAKYVDSKKYIGIQLADVVANVKHQNYSKGYRDLKEMLKLGERNSSFRKLPKWFSND